MKKLNAIITLCLSLLVTISCSSSNDSSSTNANESTPVTQSFDADCLYAYKPKYNELLTLEMIQAHYKGDMSKSEMKYRKSEKVSGQATDKCIYSWGSDRIRKMDMMGVKMELPEPNEIGIQWLGNDLFMIKGLSTPLENFQQYYRNITNEEAEEAFAKAEKIVQEKEGVSADDAKTATSFGKGLANGQTFEKVEGVGEAATWVTKENHLVVLVGEKTFQIVANVGADKEVNKNLAIALAKDVLTKCK